MDPACLPERGCIAQDIPDQPPRPQRPITLALSVEPATRAIIPPDGVPEGTNRRLILELLKNVATGPFRLANGSVARLTAEPSGSTLEGFIDQDRPSAGPGYVAIHATTPVGPWEIRGELQVVGPESPSFVWRIHVDEPGYWAIAFAPTPGDGGADAPDRPDGGADAPDGPAELSLMPETVRFDGVVVTHKSFQTVNVLYSGSESDLTTSVTGLDEASYSAGPVVCPVATRPCTLDVTFAPKTWGTAVASLVVSGKRGEKAVAMLAGIATRLEISPGVFAYGSVNVTQQKAQQFVVVNRGDTSADVLSVKTTHENFTVSNDMCTGTAVGAGRECTFTVILEPSAVATRTAICTVAAQDRDFASVSLTGTGVSAFSFSVSKGAFGEVPIGTSSTPFDFLLSYRGGRRSGTLTTPFITGQNRDDFKVTSNGCSTLDPNVNCRISVTFTPTASGLRTAELSEGDNLSSATVTLEGTGVP